ncbi:hypothetical protein [Amycolatopsis sp. SID8362]|uniref:hypothetical protein n=1 Tax=Amycolatopsis sp. SID8362 TaxID=2690346 RepID=UPI001371E598|nr:hypothetical protein [Amycolatopsis sp. SID8362]NBH11594.1 hypothetical protein [Amycolatopsis sp. SID8362]NED48286.1 hypothetical protein [Amycolatopsis sp. SID8362]
MAHRKPGPTAARRKPGGKAGKPKSSPAAAERKPGLTTTQCLFLGHHHAPLPGSWFSSAE